MRARSLHFHWGGGVAPQIGEAETNRLARLLPDQNGWPLNEATEIAVLNASERDEKPPALWEWPKPMKRSSLR